MKHGYVTALASKPYGIEIELTPANLGSGIQIEFSDENLAFLVERADRAIRIDSNTLAIDVNMGIWNKMGTFGKIAGVTAIDEIVVGSLQIWTQGTG